MLTQYIQAAMRQAQYEILDDGAYDGEIPEMPGVWVSAPALAACREELQDVSEERILLGLRLGHPISPIAGLDLHVDVKKDVA